MFVKFPFATQREKKNQQVILCIKTDFMHSCSVGKFSFSAIYFSPLCWNCDCTLLSRDEEQECFYMNK